MARKKRDTEKTLSFVLFLRFSGGDDGERRGGKRRKKKVSEKRRRTKGEFPQVSTERSSTAFTYLLYSSSRLVATKMC